LDQTHPTAGAATWVASCDEMGLYLVLRRHGRG
jgi:hypothetical protein